ncbi:MAG: dienelactone hydrolase family protein [Gemmatimonadaceae bacterium]
MRFSRLLTGACVAAGLVTACHKPMPMDDHMAHMSASDISPATPRAGTPSVEDWPSESRQNLGLPPSDSNAAKRLSSSPRHGEWVTFPSAPGSKDSIMAWVVYPSTNRAKTPVVVVVHEIFGLSTWVRSVADQVAAEGFIAIAPDFESRIRGGPSTQELPKDSATKLIRGVSPAERNQVIDAAATFAMHLTSAAPKYAVIGYCWGGQTVFIHAVNEGVPGYSGGVAFYGLPYMKGNVPIADSLMKINKPVMLLSGSKDARISAGMPAVDSAMKALHKDYSGTNYQGAAHGFLRIQDDPKTPPDPSENAANVAATKDGWPKTVAFLKKQLGI